MIRTRLIWGNSIIFAVALALIGVTVYFTTRTSLYRAVDDDLLRRSEFLAMGWSKMPGNGGPPDGRGGPPRRPGEGGDRGPGGPPEFLQNLKTLDPVMVKKFQFGAQLARPRIIHRAPQADQPEDRPQDTPFDKESVIYGNAGQTLFSNVLLEGHRLRVLTVPLKEGRRVTAVAQFAANLDDMDTAVVRLRTVLLAMLPLSLVAVFLLGIWLTHRSLRPVRDITLAAEHIEASRLSERLPVKGTDEFAVLSQRFNSMLERIEGSFRRLEDAYEAQRRFVADASHELKTPLTTVKGRVGVSLRGAQTPERYSEHMAAIGRAADTMSAIIQDLLLLASSDENKLPLRLEELPVHEVVDSALKGVPLQGREPVIVDVPAELKAKLDASLFARALGNLVGNAARHTAKDKPIAVRAAATEGGLRIQVEDQGEGIAPEHLPRIFDRFYRVHESRERGSGGTGLGLAIVKSIVEAHGGSVAIASEVGAGTTVTILLPG
jgi:two-component system OmpR family sensor kinase